MASPQSEDPVERLVASSMRWRPAVIGDVCPDVGEWAAFVEGSVGRRERRRLARHASSCPRCAEVLSVVATQDPVARFRPRATAWRWVAPMAAAIVGVGLAISVVMRREGPVTRSTESRAIKPAAAGSAGESPRAKAESPVAQERSASPADPVAPIPLTSRNAGERPLELDDDGAREARSAVSRSRASEGDTRGLAPQGKADTTASASTLIRSPDPRTMWRPAGPDVERSIDGGNTWGVQYTADRPILGGAAVSSEVAWFFGSRGLVLRRTVSGWSVATGPGTEEIASVSPRGPTDAIVTLVDGRRFETRNGGLSWVPR